jgi:hypothetical protein
MHSIKVDRSYINKDNDEWKSTNTFNCEDFPKVAVVAMEAYKFIRLQSTKQNKAGEIEAGRD